MKTNHKNLEITKDMEQNLRNGGDCSIFFILEELKLAFKDEKEVQERILTTIKPDLLRRKSANRRELELKYSILKITNKIAKMGKDNKWVYRQFDLDKNGTRKSTR